jgi:hypothetical protein
MRESTGWAYGPSGLVPEAGDLVLDSVRSCSHRLELPVMGKYSLRVTRNQWRPFPGSGFAFGTEWNTSQNRLIFRDPETNLLRESTHKTAGRSRADTGVVVSTGIAFRHGRIQSVPELRYTRWGDRNRHQRDVLFSIRFCPFTPMPASPSLCASRKAAAAPDRNSCS